jgi:putative membrane protein
MSPSQATPVSLTDYLRVTVIAGWALALLWLWSTGHFQQFIAPSLWWLLLIGVACALLFLAGILVSGGGASHHHGQADNPWVRAAVVLMPLAFVAMTAGQGSLGSYALEKRSLDMIDGPVQIEPAEPQAADQPPSTADGDSRQMTLVNLLYDLEAEQDFRVTTEGMVFHSKRLGEGQCMLFRFVMTCCAADAQPVSVILVYPGVKDIPADAWVRITGKATRAEIRGVNRAVIEADTLETISEPKQPYLSPY